MTHKYSTKTKILQVPGMFDGMVVVDNHNEVWVADHLHGFDKNLHCQRLHDSIERAKLIGSNTVNTAYIFDHTVKNLYPDIHFKYTQDLIGGNGWAVLRRHGGVPGKNFKNFVCSFNGSYNITRKLLVSALHKFKWLDKEYSSKNFSFGSDDLDHTIHALISPDRLYRKFFISDESEEFYQTAWGYNYISSGHLININELKTKISESFVQIVSETVGNSYYPFVTEKFLYPVVCKTLWVNYAQPNWHSHLTKYFGFRLYNRIFDYDFDPEPNPVLRLIKLLTMLSKFEHLSLADWHDLYMMENDTIEYNYDWYMTKGYTQYYGNS